MLDDRIQCLAGGSVITHTEDRTVLRMHRLVARVIRDRHHAEDNYPALISTAVTMLATAVFPESLAWQRRQDGERIQRLRESAEFRIYTPGSQAGLPISILKSFEAPPAVIRDGAIVASSSTPN